MDFEDSGIESDPKINSDIDTFNQNEPIISFSPERCRFDSAGQPSTRKSSTSFPISVADLQLDDPGVSALYQSSNAKNCNSITNLQNTSTTAVPRNLSIHLNHNSLTQNDQQQQQPHHHHHPQSLFQKQPFPFLHQQHQSSISTFSASPIVPGAVINTHSTATLNSTGVPISSANIPSNTNNTVGPLFPSKGSAPPDCNSIPLMVNGAAVSTNTSNTTTLDLQKRLEKHIAQATASTAVATSTSTNTSSSLSATKSNSVESKHQNDSIISDIPIPSSISNSKPGNENQISFSPSKPSCSAATHIFQPKLSSSSLWESDSSIDLWESKIAPKTGGSRIGDDFDLDDDENTSVKVMEGLLDTPPHQVVQLDSMTDTSADASNVKNDNEYSNSPEIAKLVLTTTTTTVNTSSSETSNNVNKIGKAATGKTRSNQSLRNIATNPSNVPASAGVATNSASGAAAAAAFSSSTPSVITVVNSGFDIRKVSALLPPQRLAIPTKPNPQLQSSHLTNNSKTTGITTSLSASGGSATTTTGSSNNCTGATVTFSASPFSSSNPCTTTTSVYGSSSLSTAVHKTSMSRNASISETSCNKSSNSVPPSGNGNVIKAGSNSNSSKLSSEKKPLVQWDSDESEEELSFFPSSKRGVITDNLSIDNMSLSGEEEDLHLTPPRPLTKKCPCDPRTWLERNDISNHHHGDSTHSISSKPCVIS